VAHRKIFVVYVHVCLFSVYSVVCVHLMHVYDAIVLNDTRHIDTASAVLHTHIHLYNFGTLTVARCRAGKVCC